MDRNNMRSSYINSGPRSLPHMGGSKRHNSNGHNGARLSPPVQSPPAPPQNNNNTNSQLDDLINYIYESWNKVTREIERGSEDAKYYQEVMAPRQLANFRPFNLEELWGRRFMQTINRNKHRS
ncbi:uncharacterized protein LOC128673156 [Plodia interpunctella]|uniref:uncharacterized protein LOC128673156 n=1 Tax=Plodia interpunctella TaxID=58824 RepID=UPI002368B3D8|nr:uncharacterized protein LOC128673156 [Plodia interpunctella]